MVWGGAKGLDISLRSYWQLIADRGGVIDFCLRVIILQRDNTTKATLTEENI